MESGPWASWRAFRASVDGNLGAHLLEEVLHGAEGGEKPAVAYSATVTSPDGHARRRPSSSTPGGAPRAPPSP